MARKKHTPRSLFLDLLGCHLALLDWSARQGCYECRDESLADLADYGENALKWIEGYDKAVAFYKEKQEANNG